MEAVGEVAGAPSTPLPEGRARARDGAAPVTGAQRSIRGPRHGAHGPQERCSGSDCQTWSRKHRLWGQRLPSPATGMRNQCPSWFIYKDSPGSRIVAVQSLSHVRLFATPWTAACRLLCSPLSPGVCSKSHPLSQRCHPTISSSAVSFSSCPQSFPASGSFPMGQLFKSGGQSIRERFSINPSNKYSGLISFRMDWFDLLAVQVPSPAQFKSLSASLSLTSIDDYWKNHSFD